MSEQWDVGSVLAGKYSVTEVLLQDAFEGVARASNTWGDPVLVLMFTPPGASTPTGQRALQAFSRYAQLLARTQHPGLMRVIDLITEPESSLVVLENRFQSSLREQLKVPDYQFDLTRLTRESFSALAALHAQGGLQVRVSPDSIWTGPEGHPVLALPGLAQRALQDITISTPGDERYQAPELSAGGSFSQQSDIYALAATLYEVATKRTLTTARARQQGVPLLALPDHTDPAVVRALHFALELGLAQRAVSALEVLEAMQRVPLFSPPVPAEVHPPLPVPAEVGEPPPSPPAAPASRPLLHFRTVALALCTLLALGFAAFALRGGLGGVPAVAATTSPVPDTAAPVIPDSGPPATAEPVAEAPQAAALPVDQPPTILRTEIVSAGHLNLRSDADNTSAVQTVLNRGTRVDVLAEQGTWLQVQVGALTGWVNADHTVPLIEGEVAQTVLAQLQAGGAVTLPEGAYWLDVPLTVTTDSQISGAGMNQTLLLSGAPEDTLIVQDAAVKLTALSVVHVGNQPARTVYQSGGTLEADHVAFEGAVRDEAQGAYGSGLWIADGGQATLQSSVLTDNAFGLYVSGSSVASASASNFDGNSDGGALFKDTSSGTIEDSTFNTNGAHGIHVFGQAAPILSSNHVGGNKGRGVTIYGEATPELRNNTIEKNNLQGVGVQGSAQPTLSSNIIQGNQQSGITYFENAAGRASGNTVQANAVAGITVTAFATPLLKGNTVQRNHANGIAYSDNSAGEASDNTVVQNGNPGISAWGDAQPTLTGNTIQDNRQSGVVIAERARPTLDSNDIEHNALYGLIVTDTAQPSVIGNTVSDNGQGGILYKRQAGGNGSGNTCSSNGGPGVSTDLEADAVGPDFSADGCSVQ